MIKYECSVYIYIKWCDLLKYNNFESPGTIAVWYCKGQYDVILNSGAIIKMLKMMCNIFHYYHVIPF